MEQDGFNATLFYIILPQQFPARFLIQQIDQTLKNNTSL